MKRYLIFGGDQYYPCGGWRDYRGNFDDLEEAKIFTLSLRCDWLHIVDSKTAIVVWRHDSE